jgi:hypothetical protein
MHCPSSEPLLAKVTLYTHLRWLPAQARRTPVFASRVSEECERLAACEG